MSGADANTPRDLSRATSLAQAWCDQGAALACDVYGRILWLAHDPRAVQFWDQACAGSTRDREGYQGCTHLAQALLDGENVPPDVPRALDLLTRACEAAMPDACNLLR
jgi:TPR repeat protein